MSCKVNGDNSKLKKCFRYIDINNEMKRLPMAPCILPELESIKAVIVNDPHYWPVSFVKGKNWDQLT